MVPDSSSSSVPPPSVRGEDFSEHKDANSVSQAALQSMPLNTRGPAVSPPLRRPPPGNTRPPTMVIPHIGLNALALQLFAEAAASSSQN